MFFFFFRGQMRTRRQHLKRDHSHRRKLPTLRGGGFEAAPSCQRRVLFFLPSSCRSPACSFRVHMAVECTQGASVLCWWRARTVDEPEHLSLSSCGWRLSCPTFTACVASLCLGNFRLDTGCEIAGMDGLFRVSARLAKEGARGSWTSSKAVVDAVARAVSDGREIGFVDSTGSH